MEDNALHLQITCLPFLFPGNRAFLEKAIRSVLRQSDPNWRLNVCDGSGAEPDLGEFVASFADPRIRYFQHTGRPGMAENWNRCLATAQTDLVTLLHEDDELLGGYCGEMRAAAEAFPGAAAIFCRARIIDAAGANWFSFPDYAKSWLVPRAGREIVLRGEDGVRSLLWGNFIMCPTLCYRVSHLAGRQFSPRWRFVTDLDFTLRLLREGEVVVGASTVGYAYRRHDTNATVTLTDNLQRFREEISLYEETGEAARQLGWRRAAFLARTKTVIKLHLIYSALRDLFHLRPVLAWQKLHFLNSEQ